MRAFPAVRDSVVAHGANPCAPHASQPRTSTKSALAIPLIRTRGKCVKARAYDAAPSTRHQGGLSCKRLGPLSPLQGWWGRRRETGGNEFLEPDYLHPPRRCEDGYLVRTLGNLNTGSVTQAPRYTSRTGLESENQSRSGQWQRGGREASVRAACRGATGLSGLDRHGVGNQPLRPGNAGPVARTGSASPSLHRHAGKR